MGNYVHHYIVFCCYSAEFVAYKREKALAAVCSRSGKKLMPQVSLNKISFYCMLATVSSSLASYTLCKAQEREMFLLYCATVELSSW